MAKDKEPNAIPADIARWKKEIANWEDLIANSSNETMIKEWRNKIAGNQRMIRGHD
jgi:hypothetical protein